MEHPTGLAVTEHVPDHSGVGDPLVVVLVHGALDSSASFARVLRRLPDLHTVAYDRRGYRRSRDALPLGTTLDSHVDDLLGVIGGRPAVVIGHSFGGDIALAAALRRDPRSTIVAVAAYEPPLPWLSPGGGGAGGSTLATTGTSTSGDDPEAAAERFFCRMAGPEAWRRLSPAAQAERRADGAALVAELRAIRVDRSPFDVTAMQVPAVFGRGERSIPRRRQGVAWLADHTPGSELVDIPGAAHGAHLTHPDAFADLARRVVARAIEPAPSSQ